MAIKIIKFDLPINGTKVTTLEALRDNLTDEIVPLARSGQLERWFKSRQLQEQAQAVAAAVSQHAKDKALFLALCAVLEVHPDNVGNTRVDVQPYEYKPMICDELYSEETEYIDLDSLINMFHQKAKLIGMSVGNIGACYAEQFFFSGSDPNKIASFVIDIDNTESRLCITHKGRDYLPLLHIFDNHKRHRLQLGINYKNINFTSKNITVAGSSYQNLAPLKNEELIEHQGKLLIIGEDTIYPDDMAFLKPNQINEYFTDYYNFLKIHIKLDGNEFYRIIKLMSFELSDLKLL